MALEFYKRRFRMPSKRMQYVLAFAALLLAIALVFSWIFVRHKMEEMRKNTSSTDDTTSIMQTETFTAEDRGYLLLALTEEENTRFFILQADPADRAMRIFAVQDTSASDSTDNLTTLYQKSGAAQVAGQLSERTNLPIRHYMTVSKANVQRWFSRFESGVEITFSDTITLGTEGEDDFVSIEAGTQTRNATQVTELLYRADEATAAEGIAAMLRQYFREGRNLGSDFSYLANIAQTSVRIGDFNDYRTKLTYLAKQNSLDQCTISAQTINL